MAMAIAIHVEVSSRELDSKLLLAVVAASRGHSVIVGDVIGAARSSLLPPSIFHTKSLGPSQKIIKRHAEIIARGHKITSIDEEGNLIEHEDDSPVLRYGEETVSQASAIFCWGESAHRPLITNYPHHAEKIHLTGSPRADLWTPRFANFWKSHVNLPDKPFLLVSSNMGAWRLPFTSVLSIVDRTGAFEREPFLKFDVLRNESERLRVWASFVEAISHLSEEGLGYKIIVRPHPSEDPKAWEILLSGLPNVEVTREGPISSWLNGAFALLHNGCTTALEATLAQKPVISYTVFDQKTLQLSNDLGFRATNLEELKSLIDKLFEESKSGRSHKPLDKDATLVGGKIHSSTTELASERIVNIWDALAEKNRIPGTRLLMLRLAMFAKHIRDNVLFRILPPSRRQRVRETREKFPAIDLSQVKTQVASLTEILEIRNDLRVTKLGERTILIAPRSS